MKRISLALALALLAGAAVAATGQSSAMSSPKLSATVGPGFTITLKEHGKAVKSLKAGTYTFVVSDKAAIHAFALDGPKLEKDFTSVTFVGTKTVTLKLKAGKYKFYCPPHEAVMFGHFTVK